MLFYEFLFVRFDFFCCIVFLFVLNFFAVLYFFFVIDIFSSPVPKARRRAYSLSNRKAMNRNWSNQKTNPALKTKTGNK